MPIVFPGEKNFFYSDSTEYTICTRNALGIAEDSTLMNLFRKHGRIDLLKSELGKTPKPEHRLVMKNKEGREIGFKATFYKEKARIVSFEYNGKDCN